MNGKTRAIVITGAIGVGATLAYALVRFWRDDDGDQPEPANGNKATGAASESPSKDPDRAPRPTPSAPHDTPSVTPSVTPSTGPRAPLVRPVHAMANKRINRSRTDAAGNVIESPSHLLAQAARFDPHIELDELTGARLIASEHARATFTEAACIVDTELNRARRKRRSLYRSLTHADTFGKQGRKRPASTRRDPRYWQVLAARAVLRGEARGISRGAVRFYDPVAMERMHRRYREWHDGGRQGKKPAIVSCDALTLLEAWSFDLGRGASGNRCPPDRSKRGRRPLAWVGPIAEVDPLRLFLMKPLPLGAEHSRLYEAAAALLRRGLKKE